MKIAIKVTVSIILLGCLLDMPYGYYQFVRLVTCVGFAWLAYIEYTGKRPVLVIPCILIAVLFNPFIKIYLNRDTWHIIDEIITALLAVWVVVDFVSFINLKKT